MERRVLIFESEIMATATAEKPKSQRKTKAKKTSMSEVQKLQKRLDAATSELDRVQAFFVEVEKFSDIVHKAKHGLKELLAQESALKGELSEVRAEIRSTKNLIESSNDGILQILEPGPAEFMPLFDRMEKATPEKHGKTRIQ